MASPDSLTPREARRIVVAAQGLAGKRATDGPSEMLRRLRAVQLDTISVLARSHELVPYARFGPIKRAAIEDAYWSGPPYNCFEYWSHAACVVPIEDWPNYQWRRDAVRDRGRRWHRLENAAKTIPAVLDRLRGDGPLTANALGGAKKGGPWWDWSETKIAAEWLLDIGEVVCVRRRGFQRVYDLPERAILSHLLAEAPAPDEQRRRLLTAAAGALGVATVGDLAAYTGVKKPDVNRLITELPLVPVAVGGWAAPAWAVPAVLGSSTPARRSPVMLSPFDSLIWERERVERLFGFFYRLEAYTPAPKRIHGYFSMPVLAGGELIGRVDPGRDGRTFIAKGVHLEPSVVRGRASAEAACVATARAMWTAASWVGAEDVRVDWVTPDSARQAVLDAIVATGP